MHRPLNCILQRTSGDGFLFAVVASCVLFVLQNVNAIARIPVVPGTTGKKKALNPKAKLNPTIISIWLSRLSGVTPQDRFLKWVLQAPTSPLPCSSTSCDVFWG